jgi:hypothetical protein
MLTLKDSLEARLNDLAPSGTAVFHGCSNQDPAVERVVESTPQCQTKFVVIAKWLVDPQSFTY